MVLDLVLIGLAIALNPLPVTGFVLVLSARNGIWKGLAFLLTWLATFVGIIAVVLLMTGGKPPAANSSPSTAALAVKLAVGVGLLWYAERTRRRIGTRHRSSGFMSRVERISPWSAAGLALLLQPWGMVAAGAATVVEADLAHFASYAALMGYCLLASSSLLAMELYATFAPRSAAVRLGRLGTWLEGHQEQALVSLVLFLGLWLVGKSIYGLTA
ncbi:GAP family protein [Streptomyces sp. NPDC002131]|uniref:GAP family protein n=1 Tax=unclassified Streptomyces TaxID=2593676 RepID=UPI002253B018|nr:GAP family protein [Streptomyces sp. NBC_00340]MCX5135865.1 GAP family protein [Streptomyces sp. NBC_00340]